MKSQRQAGGRPASGLPLAISRHGNTASGGERVLSLSFLPELSLNAKSNRRSNNFMIDKLEKISIF